MMKIKSIRWYSSFSGQESVEINIGAATIPISESINMLNSINKRGGNAQLKICYGLGHNAWDVAYDGDELTNWLLSHNKTV